MIISVSCVLCSLKEKSLITLLIAIVLAERIFVVKIFFKILKKKNSKLKKKL